MFYCGFDPGFEAYLARQHQDSRPVASGYLWGSAALVAVIVLGLCVGGLQ